MCSVVNSDCMECDDTTSSTRKCKKCDKAATTNKLLKNDRSSCVNTC